VQQEQDAESDSFDFLPEDSPLKGKTPASKKRAREELNEEITEGTQAVTEAQVGQIPIPMSRVAKNIQTGQ
jgi:hypothetical protein